MRLLAWVLMSSLLLTAPAFAAPIYRAGQPASSNRSLWHGELSAGYISSSQRLQYVTGEDDSPRLKGGEVRALWAPLAWLAVGGEFSRFEDVSLAPRIQDYGVQRLGGVVKLTLSPNTSPRFYVLGAVGRSKHKITYDKAFIPYQNKPPVEKETTYWTAALGVEVDIWKIIFAGVEGSWTHYSKTQFTPLYEMTSKRETALHLRAGVRF